MGNPFSTHSEWWVCAWEMTCIPCAAVRPQQWEPGSPIPLGVRPSATYGAMMCNQVRSSATWLLLTSQPSQPSQPSQLLQLSQPPCGCAVYCCLCLSQRHFLQSAHRANLQRDHRAVPKWEALPNQSRQLSKAETVGVWTVFGPCLLFPCHGGITRMRLCSLPPALMEWHSCLPVVTKPTET